MSVFERLESEVRSYARTFPQTFDQAQGSRLTTSEGEVYLDFLAGAGALNYGHNPEPMKKALLAYLERGAIVHGLDLQTEAKAAFLEGFERYILAPRNLSYRLQFCGPTGTNAVEAALKLARKATGRSTVLAFTNGFHGMTLGALAATGNVHHRSVYEPLLQGVQHVPFDGYYGPEIDTLALLERQLSDPSSGLAKPAAVLVETVQGEGGVRPARLSWLQGLSELCERHDILLIVDDIQAGCGRTGTFFSFEAAGIKPAMVTLSKSLSGFGLPFALVLVDPALDVWNPGEHNGTFRGHNLAFVTALAALEAYWKDDRFAQQVRRKGEYALRRLDGMARRAPEALSVRGRGLFLGLVCEGEALASEIRAQAFQRGLMVETCGPEDEVVKCLPPLTIDEGDLKRGFDLLEKAVTAALARVPREAAPASAPQRRAGGMA